MTTKLNRRSFLKRSGAVGGGLAAAGPLGALTARASAAISGGYGPLVDRGDLWLPAAFDYQIVSRQGMPMSDGQPTPGIFDGMGAFPGEGGRTILIRNHENRERAGEQKVVVPPTLEYDSAAFGGCTKLELAPLADGTWEVVSQFAILGGTSTNCAGGLLHGRSWLTCEEVVKRSSNGKKHGYVFEVDAYATGPVAAVPLPQLGRLAGEAAVELGGIVYVTEDRSISPDAQLGQLGACLYRYRPSPAGEGVPLHATSGPLEALKVRGREHANMNTGAKLGKRYPVEWVRIDDPDHEDDTDSRRDRVPGLTPIRIQAQDKGAAYFDRVEGAWVGHGKLYFDCTSGGAAGLGQVWEYDPARKTITLIYESTDAARLENPDNVVIVPATGDVFLCEDGDGEQFVRGVTLDGKVYDFARSGKNETEFCGACFSPDGGTLFLNQQGARGSLPDGPAEGQAVTYAIRGPF